MSEQGDGASARPGTASVAILLEQRLRAAAELTAREQYAVPSAEDHEELPAVASFGQQWLWLLAQLTGDSPEYHVHQVLRVSGPLAPDVLHQAMQDVVGRHDVLRTIYRDVGGVPEPIVLPASPIEVPVLDVPAVADQEEAALRLARELVRRPFDLGTELPVRLWLLRLGEQEWLLVLALHHIATDGWSMPVLWRELAVCHRARLDGREPRLPALPLSYARFARSQRAALTEDVRQRLLGYWRERLAGLTVLQLPADHPRPPARSGRGAELTFPLPAELLARLREAGSRHRVTLFVIGLAAFQTVLARWSAQRDLAVGTPVMGRHDAELEDLVGYFVNTVVLRGDFSGDPTPAELLRRTRDTAFEAYAHQELPFEQLVADLKPGRDLSRTPLFQVMFTLDEDETAGFTLPGAEVRPVPMSNGTCQFDLSVALTTSVDGVTGTIGYDSELFDASTAERLGHHLVLAMEWLAGTADRPLSQLELRTGRERAVVDAANATTAPFAGSSVHELIAEQARRYPDATAVLSGETGLTYAELDRRADRLARRLNAHGAGRDRPVAVHVDRTPELLVALLAVLKSGAPYLPLDPALPAGRLELLRADCGAELVVTCTERAGIGGTAVLLDAAEVPVAVPAPPIRQDDLAYVIYTSGSTGRPKGVMVPHRGVVNLAADLIARWRIRPGERVAATASFGFDMSVPELLVPLLAGATVVLIDRDTATDARALAAVLEREGVTLMQATPAGWELLLDGGWSGSPALRAVCGADTMPTGLARRLRGRVAELWNLYGPTETTVWSTAEAAVDGSGTGDCVPIGTPLTNTRAHVFDDAGRPVPIGVTGELYLGGDGVTRGYFGAPALTAERFVPDQEVPGARLYRTGDLARWRPGGTLEFLGRRDTQVKIRGYRIELGEVRAALTGHPAVDTATAAVRGTGSAAQLVGYVVWSDPAAPHEDLRGYLRERLPSHLVPSVIAAVDAIPLSANGKIDLSRLPAPALEVAPSRAPATVTERQVHAVWAEVLGHGDFGADEDFFALGGHSLAALGATGRLRETFGGAVDVHLLFRHSTVATLAAALAERTRGPGEPSAIPRRRPGSPAPLSSAQRRLWFLHELRPDRVDYHVVNRMRLSGPLDAASLTAAVRHVVSRHDVLRCRFENRPGGLVQTPATVPVEVSFTDLSATAAAADGEIGRAALARPFDLSTGPLLRAHLYRFAPGDHRLDLILHHAVVDGRSITLLWREISAAYREFHSGRTPVSAGPELQYADYAAWQQETPMPGREADLAHWRARLGGRPLFELPPDRPRPAEWSGRGAQLDFDLPPATARRLAQLAAMTGTTLFMTLLALFHATLAVHSGESEVRIGTPVGGRVRPETEPLVGCFVNTVVLGVELGDDPAFLALLDRVRTDTVAGLAHQGTPFEKVVDDLKPDRDPSRNPLFSVMFSVDADDTLALDLGAIEVREQAAPVETAKVDLALSLIPLAGRLAGSFAYATDLFDRTTIERLARTFAVLTDAVLDGPDRRLSDLDLLGARPRRALLSTTRPVPTPRGPAELLADVAARQPVHIAVRSDTGVLTHGELQTRARRLAVALRSRGIGREEVVVIALPRTPDLIVALLGVLLSGGACLAIDPRQPAARTRLLIADSRARLMITDQDLGEIGSVERLPVNAAAESPADLPGPAAPDALAAVYYTSGSTGRPKAVGLTHGGIGNYLGYLQDTIGLTGTDVALPLAPVSFDASIRDLLGPLAAGGSIVLPPDEAAKDPYVLVAEIARHRVTVLPSLVPAMLSALSAVADPASAPDRSALRLALVSGEPLTARHVTAAARLSPSLRLINQYGPTEATMTSTWHEVTADDVARDRIPIGQPIRGTRCLLLGRRGELLPPGALGELHLSSPGTARGYLGAPGRTAERFVPDPFGPPGARLFRTGDFARWDGDDQLVFHGRRDEQVKIRGVRVELGEVEAALADCDGVAAAAAKVFPGPNGYELAGYLVPAGPGLDPREVRRRLKELLPDQLVPGRYVVVDELPRTPHGKLDRARLPEPAAEQATAMPPRDLTELRMTRLWERVLDRTAIGIRDDFFALGGHSLTAVALVDEIRAELGVAVPLHAVFRLPTPEQLCQALPTLTAESERLVIPLVDGPAGPPPLFLVHPQGGGVCCYLDLARRVPGRVVHGVEAVGQNTAEQPLDRIEDMAARYLDEIRAAAPDGPYLLAGWSFGGNVAFELAHRLEREGAEVGFLGILDARVFGRDPLDEWYLATAELERYGRVAGLGGEDLQAMSTVDEQEAMAILLRDAQAHDQVSALADVATMRRMVNVFTANGRAAQQYHSSAKVTADIHLFRARDRHPTLTNPVVDPAGWAERTTGTVHTTVCPGTHHDLLYPPHAEALGDRIAQILAGLGTTGERR